MNCLNKVIFARQIMLKMLHLDFLIQMKQKEININKVMQKQ